MSMTTNSASVPTVLTMNPRTSLFTNLSTKHTFDEVGSPTMLSDMITQFTENETVDSFYSLSSTHSSIWLLSASNDSQVILDTEYEPYRLFMVGSRYWVQKVLVPLLVLIGIIGNSVTILVLSRPRMRSSTNTYLTALAISDLLYLLSVFSLSLQHHPQMSHPKYWLYWHFCKYAYWITDASSE